MARPRSAAWYEEKARIAKAREAYYEEQRKQKQATATKAPPTTIVYLRDIIYPATETFYQLQVRTRALEAFTNGAVGAGITDAGLLAKPPTGKRIVELTKGNKTPIFKVRWYFGNETIEVKGTPWGTTVRKPYDEISGKGQSHFSVPFGKIEGKSISLAGLVNEFEKWANLEKTKNNVIGVSGRAELIFGYGNMYTILARATA